MKSYSYYYAESGLFTGRSTARISLPREIEGCLYIEGIFDHLSQRIDIATGKVIDYQPPRPSADHEWVHDEDGVRVRRWRLNKEAQEAINADKSARIELAEIDSRLIRYLDEKDEGTIDSVGLQKISELRERKKSLRLLLKRTPSDA